MYVSTNSNATSYRCWPNCEILVMMCSEGSCMRKLHWNIFLLGYKFALHTVYFLGLSTLRRYFQNFQVAEGYLWSVDQLIRIKAQELTELQRIVTIQIDEVYLKSDINYVRVHHMFSRILNFLFVIDFFLKKNCLFYRCIIIEGFQPSQLSKSSPGPQIFFNHSDILSCITFYIK